jgi:hypothetical protein
MKRRDYDALMPYALGSPMSDAHRAEIQRGIDEALGRVKERTSEERRHMAAQERERDRLERRRELALESDRDAGEAVLTFWLILGVFIGGTAFLAALILQQA